MKRHGFVIRANPETLEAYKRIHIKIWPEIEQAIREAGITNYSIYYKDGFLFAYYEYTGPEAEYEARLAQMANAPRMREWWDMTETMQVPLETRKEGEWWASMEEVFHQD